MYIIREASPADVHPVAALLRQYMLETYDHAWRGSVNALLQDGFGTRFRALVAVLADDSVGLLAWEKSYDLHHCLSGGHVLDLYVAPRHRARGIAVQLIATAAGIIHSEGGAFIKGEPSTVARGLACTGGSPPRLATTTSWAGKRSAIWPHNRICL
jgi:GNAT superfamily N-acetyltransferase